MSETLDCSLSTIRRQVRQRRLRVVRIGSLVRVSETDLAAYIASRSHR